MTFGEVGTDANSKTWTHEPRPIGAGDLVAILVWTAAVVAFFWKAVSLSEALFYFDITEINFPYRDFLAREMRLGRFSRWFPGLYCGLPLYSESPAGYWHPLKFAFYWWLDAWKAFNLDTVASVWLTGLATYGWLRRHVGPPGALTGAALFGFSGFVWAHLIHTSMTNALISVPLVVWSLECAWDGRRRRGVALGALALACQVFAGHLQDTLLTAALVGVYAVYRALTEKTVADGVRAMTIAVALVVLGVLIASVQWIPSKELLDRSPRAGGLSWPQLTYGSWNPELLPSMAIREAYGTRARDTDWMDGYYPYHEMNTYLGLIGLALAVVGGAARRDRWVGFWIVLTWFAVLLMLGKFTFLFDHLHKVPVLGSSRIPVRFHLWMSLGVAALASVGVDRLSRPGVVRLRAAGALVAGVVLASLPILYQVYRPVWEDARRWNTAYHLDRFGWLGRELGWASLRTFSLGLVALFVVRRLAKSGRAERRLVWILPMLVMLDLLGAHAHDVPTIDPRYWTEPPPTVAALKGDPTLLRVFGTADRSAGEPGYASEKVDFFAARDTLGWSLAPVWGIDSSIGETPIIPKRLLAYTDNALVLRGRLDIEGVSHVVVGQYAPALDPKPIKAGSAYIHRNPNVLPRARLLGRPLYAVDEAEAAALVKNTGAAIRERIVVEDPDHPMSVDASVEGTATIVVNDPEHVAIETECRTPAYLMLADTFDPGWSATVDGVPRPIRPAYVGFRAVFLEKGTHRVEFRYRPAGFGLGLAITLAGLALALAVLATGGPGFVLSPSHAELPWTGNWPRIVLAAFVLIVAASAVGIGPGGRPTLHSRWDGAFHRFTWGAGIEAINPMRSSIGR